MLLSAADLALLSQLIDQALDCEPAQLDGWLAALPPDQAHLRSPLRATLDARRARERDLDALPNEALKQRPAERCATADALADDLQRHLAGDAVNARPNTPGDRVVKTLRRHRVGVATAAALLVAAISGAGAALVRAERANVEVPPASAVRDVVHELRRPLPRDRADRVRPARRCRRRSPHSSS